MLPVQSTDGSIQMPATDIADAVMLAQSGADMVLLSDRDALGRPATSARPPSPGSSSLIKQVDRAFIAAESMLEGHSPSEPISPRISSNPLTDVEALLHGAAAAAVDCSAGEPPAKQACAQLSSCLIVSRYRADVTTRHHWCCPSPDDLCL